jgi:hypothetical protein
MADARMYVTLLALGLITVLVGLVMVGFGIENNGFDTGNTLIVAGTTALVGGLLLIGLSAVLRQLRDIAVSLEMRSSPVTRSRLIPETSDETEIPSAARGIPTQHSPEPSGLDGVDKASTPEERGVAVQEESAGVAAYAPSRAQRARIDADRRRGVGGSWQTESPRGTEGPEWQTGEPGRAVPTHRGPPGSGTDAGAADDERAHDDPSRAGLSGSPQGATILKSGVIEGMAYTLYSDGSIEAELPQGTLKFGSVQELRDYLAGKG